MEEKGSPAATASEEEKQEAAQLKELELRLEGVRSAKKIVQEQLDQLDAEAKKLELLERKSQQQIDAHATKLTRLQQLQADEAKRREEAQTRRAEQDAARKRREEEERQRRERAVDGASYGDDADLATLEEFLADESRM